MNQPRQLIKIEKAVKSLSEDELREFRAWFHEYDSERWDARFEEDVSNGVLDALAEKALKQHKAQRTDPL